MFLNRGENVVQRSFYFVVASAIVLIQETAHQMTDKKITAVIEGSTILPCKLKDTREFLDQISWQRRTEEQAQDANFLTIQDQDKVQFVDKPDHRFKFIGDFSNKDGTLNLSDVSLEDEGTYACIFSLFPSGYKRKGISLNVLVPPSTSLVSATPTLGDKEVTLATCTAAASKPPAELRWDVGTLGERVSVTVNKTLHTNGTTTTVGLLVGKPSLEVYGHLVRCIITSEARKKEEALSSEIQVLFSPTDVNITERPENTFQCEVNANPTATITWRRLDRSLPSSVKTQGSTLQLLGMTSELNGLYQCETANPYGRKKANLYVHVAPEGGSCNVCWILFSLLVFLNLVGTALFFYKAGAFQRCKRWGEQVPTSSSTPEEAAETDTTLT